jgi:hypothetical protein
MPGFDSAQFAYDNAVPEYLESPVVSAYLSEFGEEYAEEEFGQWWLEEPAEDDPYPESEIQSD